jgi:hypothetical protein
VVFGSGYLRLGELRDMLSRPCRPRLSTPRRKP